MIRIGMMIRIGITGHQRLDDETGWQWVRGALVDAVARSPRPFAGLSSLAIGADQLLASIVLDHDGTLEVVVPFPDYRSRFADEQDAKRYDVLLSRASQVEVLPAQASDQAAYLAAGKRIVERSDEMYAVWDGQPAADVGGTGDIVQYARDVGRKLTVFDPVTRTLLLQGRRPAGDSL
jgi:hypothetical protein